MIKKFVALISAVIIFLTSPVAQAEENVGTDLVDEPFTQQKIPPAEGVEEPLPSDEPEKVDPSLEPPYSEPPVISDSPYSKPPPPPPSITDEPVEEVEGLEFLVYHQNGVMAFAIIADHEKYLFRPVLARGKVPGRATVPQMNAPDALATINAS